MNFKSLMLAAAAATAAATGAQAADLPVAPEPVDYVRVCDAYGAGFFYIPGTETCLRVSGGVRADYWLRDFADTGTANFWDNDADQSTRFRARAYVRHDSRTNTEFGLLRTYSDIWVTSDNTVTSVLLWQAFVQWGGFTFGKASSFYDGTNGYNWGSQMGAAFDVAQPPELIGYTASFGNGMSAGLSLESDVQRRLAIAGTGSYGGHRIPAIVANLRVSQGWGSAGIYGVARQVLTVNTPVDDDPMGYAVAADVEFNLPMVSSGTRFAVRAAYGNGATGYVSRNLTIDAEGIATGIKKATAWGVLASLSHAWTPTLSTAFTGTYAKQDLPTATNDLTIWTLQGQVAWTPVSGLTVGTEVEYGNGNFGGGAADEDYLSATFRVQKMF